MKPAKLIKSLIVCAILATAILLSGCSSDEREAINGDVLRSANLGGASLYTIDYDGHWWVVCSRGMGGGIVHHPDCPACNGENE